MMHIIRTALSRDLGGMGNVDLYRHSYVGTKRLIEQYVDSTIQTINCVISQSASDHGVKYKELLEGMLLARQSFGRSALLLSGGGTFGMAHIGVLKALFAAQLLPRIISGASAGSIVCAVVCTKTDEEIPVLIKEFPYGDLAVFESPDNQNSILDHLRRLLTEGSWSDIGHLGRVMRGMMGDITFQEAYNRTRRILNICVSTSSVYELPRLLNYVTAPNVMIWSAVAASCSVPLIFDASPLLVKDPVTGEHRTWNPTPQHFIDGSVDNDLPMTRLAEMFNVNHFIVSQVNPHVVPFLSKDDHLRPDNGAERPTLDQRDDQSWVYTFTSVARDEALHRLQFMAEMGIFPNLMTKFRSILSQKYSGDINILPEMTLDNLPVLLSNPTTDFMLRACLIGERATWPKLSRVRDRCAVELALDRAVHRLRTRVIFSESQGDLRAFSSKYGNLQLSLRPSTSSQHSAAGTALAGHGQKRQRRRSGGSLLTLPGSRVLIDTCLTDDETAEEERLEILSRGGQGPASPAAARKPRLKRASKSQIHVPQHHGSFAPLSRSEVEGFANFNFAKPITPPEHDDCDPGHNNPQDNGSQDKDAFPSESGAEDAGYFPGRIHTPVEDMETSEQGHSSDADGEQGTEESDPEPFDGSFVQDSPKATTPRNNDNIFGPVGRVTGHDWLI